MNDLSLVRVIALGLLLVLIAQYAGVARTSWYRFKRGRNGLTVSILINSVALGIFKIALFLFILYPLPEGIVTMGMVGVVITNFYMIATMWHERNKPIKPEPYIRGRLFRALEKELPDEQVK